MDEDRNVNRNAFSPLSVLVFRCSGNFLNGYRREYGMPYMPMYVYLLAVATRTGTVEQRNTRGAA